MTTFLKYILQLILSPSNGWTDLSTDNPDPERLLTRGLYPLMGISAATEFLALVYHQGIGLMQVLSAAVTDFGAYFLAIFISRLVLDLFMPKVSEPVPDQRRINTFIVAAIGLMVLFRIVDNCCPWNLMLLKFLPFYVVLVLSKAFAYMNVRRRDQMRFLGVAAGVTVGVPLGIYYLIYMLIQ